MSKTAKILIFSSIAIFLIGLIYAFYRLNQKVNSSYEIELDPIKAAYTPENGDTPGEQQPGDTPGDSEPGDTPGDAEQAEPAE